MNQYGPLEVMESKGHCRSMASVPSADQGSSNTLLVGTGPRGCEPEGESSCKGRPAPYLLEQVMQQCRETLAGRKGRPVPYSLEFLVDLGARQLVIVARVVQHPTRWNWDMPDPTSFVPSRCKGRPVPCSLEPLQASSRVVQHPTGWNDAAERVIAGRRRVARVVQHPTGWNGEAMTKRGFERRKSQGSSSTLLVGTVVAGSVENLVVSFVKGRPVPYLLEPWNDGGLNYAV